MVVDVVKASEEAILQEARNFEGALVYLDEGAAEAFHFAGGLPLFFKLGVRALCELENAASSDAEIKWNAVEETLDKIVIVTSQLLNDAHRYILRCLRLHPSIQRCFIYCSISEDAHSGCAETPLGSDAFSDYRDLLLQDLYFSDSEKVAESPQAVGEFSDLSIMVLHLPLLCCPLTPKVFVLPSKAKIAGAPLASKKENTFLSSGLPACDNGTAWDEDELLPSGAMLHAHFLSQLAGQLDLKFDIFSLGPLSHIVGKHIADISTRASDGAGRARKSAGLLLLDRSLDLITPSCHGDSLVDRIYSVLPRRASTPASSASDKKRQVPRHSTVVQIPTFRCEDAESLQEKDVTQAEDNSGKLWGSLSVGSDAQAADRLGTLFEKKAKDGAVYIRKCLQEVLRQERIELSGKSRLTVTPSELWSLLSALLGSPKASVKHTGLVQLGKAAAEALDPAQGSKWEALASAERVLSISATDGVENLALQVLDLVKQSSSEDDGALISLRDALTVIIAAYGLAGDYSLNEDSSGGPFSWEQERLLKEAVVDAILQGPPTTSLGFLDDLNSSLEGHWTKMRAKAADSSSHRHDDWSEEQWENWDENEEQQQQEFGELQLKLELKDKVEELFSVLHRVAAARMIYPMKTIRLGPGVFRGLVTEVLSLVLSKADVPGLKHHSSTVGRLLKTGLGRFGLRGQAAPRLSDHKILIIFVIGGINAVEVREAKALQGDFEELVVGGTTFLTPDDMYKLVFCS